MAKQVEKATSPKEKRMAKAVRLHYMQGMDYQQIAKEMGLSYGTVRKYFTEDKIQELKRHFSDQELYELQRTLERQVKDAEAIAHDCVSKAKELADSSRAYNKTAKTALEIPKRKIKMLQEMGVIQKPKERKEVQETSKDMTDVQQRLQEAYRERMEAQKND